MNIKISVRILLGLIVIFSIAFGYFIGTHTLKLSISSNIENKIFYKNGYRFKKVEPPKNYVSYETACNSEFLHTARYFLYKIFAFQKMTPEERIKEFEQPGMDSMLLSENFGLYAERGKQYKIADNYCIATVANEYYANKVECNKMALSVDKLPYERAIAFEEKDDEGIFYKSYTEELWKEFEKLGVRGVEKQLNEDYHARKDYCIKKQDEELASQGMVCDPRIQAVEGICVPIRR